MIKPLCQPPAGMTGVFDLPLDTLNEVCQLAAEVAMRYDTALAILGVCEAGGVYCWAPCWASHPEALLAIPDLMVVQMAANGRGDVSLVRLERSDGRSVHLYRSVQPT